MPNKESVKYVLDLIASRRSYFSTLLCVDICVDYNVELVTSLFDGMALLPKLRWVHFAVETPLRKTIRDEMGIMHNPTLDVLKGIDNPFPLLEFFSITDWLSLDGVCFGDSFYSHFLEKCTYLRHFAPYFG